MVQANANVVGSRIAQSMNPEFDGLHGSLTTAEYESIMNRLAALETASAGQRLIYELLSMTPDQAAAFTTIFEITALTLRMVETDDDKDASDIIGHIKILLYALPFEVRDTCWKLAGEYLGQALSNPPTDDSNPQPPVA